MKNWIITAALMVLTWMAGCAGIHSNVPGDSDRPTMADSLSKVDFGMYSWDIDKVLHCTGRKVAPLPNWPRTLREIPGYEKNPDAEGELYWRLWRVGDAHKWVAVGFSRAGDMSGGSLTMAHAVIKKSGLDGHAPPQ